MRFFIFISIILGLVGVLFWAPMAKAATVIAGPLEVTFSGDQLFSENNMYPGMPAIEKLMTIKNTGIYPHSFSIAASGVSGSLAEVLQIEPRDDGAPIWNQTLAQLASLPNGSKIIISEIAPGATKDIQIAAILPPSAGNDLQGQSTINFDFTIGDESTDQAEPTPTPVVRGSLARVRSLFGATGTVSPPSETPTVTATVSASPIVTGEVKGEQTDEKGTGLNPWYLAIAPLVVIASVIFWPEFAFAGGMAAVSGGVSYVLGYSSHGNMNLTTFYIILISEVLVLIILAYFMLHHDNRASRRIRGYRHRLRIR